MKTVLQIRGERYVSDPFNTWDAYILREAVLAAGQRVDMEKSHKVASAGRSELLEQANDITSIHVVGTGIEVIARAASANGRVGYDFEIQYENSKVMETVRCEITDAYAGRVLQDRSTKPFSVERVYSN